MLSLFAQGGIKSSKRSCFGISVDFCVIGYVGSKVRGTLPEDNQQFRYLQGMEALAGGKFSNAQVAFDRVFSFVTEVLRQ